MPRPWTWSGLAGKAGAHLSDLSGGERRRTFIAMTLVQGAGLLLLDEPLANLDIKYQIELVRLLRKLREAKNISVVMALHDINIALQFDTVMLIKNGNLIGSGRPGDRTDPGDAEAGLRREHGSADVAGDRDVYHGTMKLFNPFELFPFDGSTDESCSQTTETE